jgi:hypothetical protein
VSRDEARTCVFVTIIGPVIAWSVPVEGGVQDQTSVWEDSSITDRPPLFAA